MVVEKSKWATLSWKRKIVLIAYSILIAVIVLPVVFQLSKKHFLCSASGMLYRYNVECQCAGIKYDPNWLSSLVIQFEEFNSYCVGVIKSRSCSTFTPNKTSIDCALVDFNHLGEL